eukprot:m.56697 g.56697  ORF g.56697 m.56697 type:complete len:171 (-) comp12053_c1_seq2:690-1202(-)
MMRGHTTGKKPRSFGCSHCGRAFETLQLQRIHEMSHGSGAPFCELCGKQFARGASLIRHLAMCRTRNEASDESDSGAGVGAAAALPVPSADVTASGTVTPQVGQDSPAVGSPLSHPEPLPTLTVAIPASGLSSHTVAATAATAVPTTPAIPAASDSEDSDPSFDPRTELA